MRRPHLDTTMMKNICAWVHNHFGRVHQIKCTKSEVLWHNSHISEFVAVWDSV